MRLLRISAFVVAATILIVTTSSQARVIREEDFGEAWPFRVSEGELNCSRHGVVTFKANGVTYAVNGTAKSAGFARIEPIWKLNWAMYEKFAKALGVSVEQAKEQIGSIRISIGPIIDAGLVLCGN